MSVPTNCYWDFDTSETNCSLAGYYNYTIIMYSQRNYNWFDIFEILKKNNWLSCMCKQVSISFKLFEYRLKENLRVRWVFVNNSAKREYVIEKFVIKYQIWKKNICCSILLSEIWQAGFISRFNNRVRFIFVTSHLRIMCFYKITQWTLKTCLHE